MNCQRIDFQKVQCCHVNRYELLKVDGSGGRNQDKREQQHIYKEKLYCSSAFTCHLNRKRAWGRVRLLTLQLVHDAASCTCFAIVGYELIDRGIVARFLSKGSRFNSFPMRLQRCRDQSSLVSNMYYKGLFSSELKWPQHVADRSALPISDVRNECFCSTSYPKAFLSSTWTNLHQVPYFYTPPSLI